MLNKEQALAAMDAQIVRVEAERLRRLERRMGRVTMLYPALRAIPLDQREDLVAAAKRDVFRRWTMHATAVLMAAAVCVLIIFREQIPGSKSGPGLFLAVLVPVALLNLSQYLHIRFAVKRLVAFRFAGRQQGSSPAKLLG